jgi:hypothetical protein
VSPVKNCLPEFQDWIAKRASRDPYFAGTFWLVLSEMDEAQVKAALKFQPVPVNPDIPCANAVAEVTITGRDSKQSVAFWNLPFTNSSIYIFFSQVKPSIATRFAYRFIRRARGKAQLFPLSHQMIRSCAQLDSHKSLDSTRVLRGVSYPSRPEEGGAEIYLKPGNAVSFFEKVEDDHRILKSARMKAPIGDNAFCEYSVSRIGYVSYHRGPIEPLLNAILGRLSKQMVDSARPFKEARNNFVGLRFPEPVFANPHSYTDVIQALARLPQMSIALIHANPYFHAAMTNYEDGAEFDIFITDASTVHVKARGETSPASFLSVHNQLSEVFREAKVSIEKPETYSLSDLLAGRV